MNAWEPLREGVTWRSAPLLNFRASRRTMARHLGPPHATDVDSNGLGPADAWGLRFPCGLEITLMMFQLRNDFSAIDDVDEPANIELQASAPQERHILFHLPIEEIVPSSWEPSPLLPEPLLWRVLRQDDNGNRFEVERYASRCEALAIVVAFEALGHKQMYWVDEAEAQDGAW